MVKNLNVDKKNKTISYVLTKPAVVRIRVGSKSGPLHKTLVNWQQQKKGKQIIKWNGMDASGTFDILDRDNFTYSFNYYLGKNEPREAVENIEGELIISDHFIGRVSTFKHISQNHKNHDKKHCRDLEVLFSLPENIQKTEDGFVKISGACPITIEFSAEDKSWFIPERLSVNIFIDDIFVKGEALGYIPYTWNFNPEGMNKGKHLITINLKGFNDHIAIGSLPIYIEPETANKEQGNV